MAEFQVNTSQRDIKVKLNRGCAAMPPLLLENYSKKRRLTLRPLVEDTSDKSQTLEGVTLEQKTSYLIFIWTLQGSLVNLSIYIFEFVGCSEK